MKLIDYLDGRVHKTFAEKAGIVPSSLYQILRKGKKPSIDLAFRIEKATDGAVTLYDWVSKDTPKASENAKTQNKSND